jgi:hypothetical protein
MNRLTGAYPGKALIMRQVMHVVDAFRDWIEDHPLQQWLIDESDGASPEQKLWAGLFSTIFIMRFSEMNRYHVSYGDPDGLDPQRRTLSLHAAEDTTHSRLFLQDFCTLGWNERLDWRPSEVLHWLFTSEVTEGFRRRTELMTNLMISQPDPAVRYAMVEAIEAAGNALFRRTAQVANRYSAATGKDLVYWGEHHLALEDGHVVGDEDVFENLVLSPAQRNAAVHGAARVFELFDEQNSEMLTLAQETLSQGGFESRRARYAPPAGPAPVGGVQHLPLLVRSADLHPSQRPIHASLQRCVEAVRRSAALSFFKADTPEEALARLRLGLLFMAPGAGAAVATNRYTATFPRPVNAAERAINRLARRTEPRAPWFYADWASLDLDNQLGWSFAQTLEFVHLHPLTEASRDLRAVIHHYLASTSDPVLRYWTLVTVETLAGACLDEVRPLARQVEEQAGLSLPYLTRKLSAGRAAGTRHLEDDPAADALRFEALPVEVGVTEEAVAIVEEISSLMLRELSVLPEARAAGLLAGPGHLGQPPVGQPPAPAALASAATGR